MEKRTKMQPFQLPFNPKDPSVLHIDLNSCFATIEQQANPKLRGKPIAVAAYNSPSGCILAPSIEAKRFGIKTGMRVKEGKLLYPNLIVLSPDPWKYRTVHLRLRKLLSIYTDKLAPKSIDEFVLNLEGYPAFKKGIVNVAAEIKKRIKEEIGDWLTVSIGIAPNRFLAKTGAGLRKPDGLDVINQNNYEKIFQSLKLTDLCGIKARNAARLGSMGIHTVMDFYNAPVHRLKSAFSSINGYYWHVRLHGWEIDDVESLRKSFGNSFALPRPLANTEELAPILQKLVEKTGSRLRNAGYAAQGVHLSLVFQDHDWWHHGHTISKAFFDSRDIYKEVFRLLINCPKKKPVILLAESCFNLQKLTSLQPDLFGELGQKTKLTQAVDKINQRWGNFVITPARMLGTQNTIPDRIAFGGIKELEEILVR